MTDPYWPLFDLRLTTPDLQLTTATEADQVGLSALMSADVEPDPAAPSYNIADDGLRLGIYTHQAYWKAFGTWRPESWTLPFAVRRDGELIGLQQLEGEDFAVLRTVDSFSFLATRARGTGYGKQMREAVLALAFGPLAAVRAITSAWRDNHASLGVSRALGYVANGETLHRREADVDVMVHLRLSRDDWLARTDRPTVDIAGFEPCRPLFGLQAS
jgi:RimJ/RimL family protein N-acetyltransferase